jgi:hypothetical protein
MYFIGFLAWSGMLLTPRAPSTAVERARWLRLAPLEPFNASFEELLDGPFAFVFPRGVRGDLDPAGDAPDIVEVRDITGEALVGVEAFVGNEAEVSASTVPV